MFDSDKATVIRKRTLLESRLRRWTHRGVHVVAVDLPGHGTHLSSPFSYARAVENVGTLLAAVGPAVVVGLFLGGYVGMRVAAEHGTHITPVNRP
ncbi:alpha/beta fold hydrolase [Halobacterium hubeiense]|uniref:alpha/beta fold hydrolase n=1 Tax=Halobacterium hubeiense TaxID=1407499 RepID=UPI003C7328AC